MKQYYTGGQCLSCSCAIIPNPIIPAIYSVAGIFLFDQHVYHLMGVSP